MTTILKKLFIFITILTIILTLSACDFANNPTSNSDNNTQINRTSLETETNNNVSTFDNNSTEANNDENNQNPNQDSNSNNANSANSETELYSFSTVLKSKSPGRLNNIRITCSKINGQTLDVGQEFSFDSIVGSAKPEEGYQKADIFVNKQIVQAYGGGNCQVSTTLYNAVLGVSGISITERHPHGRKVNYVPEGKDAAVSHGTLDLKFKNNTDSQIKIYASSDDVNVTVKIVKVS